MSYYTDKVSTEVLKAITLVAEEKFNTPRHKNFLIEDYVHNKCKQQYYLNKKEEEKQEMLDCIHNLMGFFDTPIAKMKMRSNDCEEVRQIGRDVMKKYGINHRGI